MHVCRGGFHMHVIYIDDARGSSGCALYCGALCEEGRGGEVLARTVRVCVCVQNVKWCVCVRYTHRLYEHSGSLVPSDRTVVFVGVYLSTPRHHLISPICSPNKLWLYGLRGHVMLIRRMRMMIRSSSSSSSSSFSQVARSTY